MNGRQVTRRIAWVAVLVLLSGLVLPSAAYAKTAQEIDASVTGALARFKSQVKGADAFLQNAQAVLVFPGVVQAGFGIGGEFGKGALRVHDDTVDYYSLGAGSIGFQFGAQVKDVIIVFLERQALDSFRAKHGWNVGVDGSVVLVNLGAHAALDTTTYNEPVVGFVVGQKGLMYNLTLQGSKITRITPSAQ